MKFRHLSKIIIAPQRREFGAVAQPRLHEIGKFRSSLASGDYQAGQCFIHKAFAYRGVILFPWTTEVHNRSDKLGEQTDSEFLREFVAKTKTPTVPAKVPMTQTYYQVLIHENDWGHARLQSDQPTVVTLSGAHLELPTAQGLDNVSHNEIIPYDSSEAPLINHKLFHYLFSQQKDGNHEWTGTNYLEKWHAAQKAALTTSNVYTATTQDIKVTVIPYFVGASKRFDNKTYWWRYSVRVELLGRGSAIVRQRELRIYTDDGKTNVDQGRGLNAQTEPELSDRQKVYQTMTHVKLNSRMGHAWGTMTVERRLPNSMQTEAIKVNIPTFHLEAVDID